MHRNYCDRDRKSKRKPPKCRPVECFGEFLQFKRGAWHAVMPVPRDVQEAIPGKATRKVRFDASLDTDDVEEAITRLPAQIDEWRGQITKARRMAAKIGTGASW